MLAAAIIAGLPALSTATAVAAGVEATAEFFVDAVHGDDSASGLSTSSAFATLRRAQLAVRQVTRSVPDSGGGGTPLATVSLRSTAIHWVHRGINSTDVALQSNPEPIAFSGPDSGTTHRPVVWQTYPGDAEYAVVSAGFPVPPSWTATADDAGLYEVHIPSVAAGLACPQQLWVGSERLTRARLPHTGFLRWSSALNPENHTDEINLYGFVYDPQFDTVAAKILAAHNGSTLQAANISVVTMHIWGDSHSTLDSINLTARSLHWVQPSTTPVGLYESGMPGSTGHRFFLDNTDLGLDAVGSWHVNCDSGLLRYRPRDGEDPNSLTFVAAGASEVFVFGDLTESDVVDGAQLAYSLHDAMDRHKTEHLPMQRSYAVDPCGDPAAKVHFAAGNVAKAHSANVLLTTDDTVASNILLQKIVLSHNNYACPTGRSCGGSDAAFQVRS